MRKIVFTFLLIAMVLALKSQNTTSRLSMVSEGETLFFNFNSFEKYRNGMSLSTIATVYFIDTTNVGVQTALLWELDVKASTANIVGDYGNTLPLSTIEIEVSGNDVTALYNGPLALTNVDNVHLVQNGAQTPGSFTTLTLTYHVGTTTPLLGEKPDYYFVDILYTLQPQ
ncbi:MAG: hypothetical protein L3J35_07985 [Bacteroidales bacterium]|nr:hypothetical protein [Bacteroidales bacterium]